LVSFIGFYDAKITGVKERVYGQIKRDFLMICP
jgi:hypothetical protein